MVLQPILSPLPTPPTSSPPPNQSQFASPISLNHSQYVGDDSYTPHVRGQGQRLVAHNFGGCKAKRHEIMLNTFWSWCTNKVMWDSTKTLKTKQLEMDIYIAINRFWCCKKRKKDRQTEGQTDREKDRLIPVCSNFVTFTAAYSSQLLPSPLTPPPPPNPPSKMYPQI